LNQLSGTCFDLLGYKHRGGEWVTQ
jgi:hypothetical protein